MAPPATPLPSSRSPPRPVDHPVARSYPFARSHSLQVRGWFDVSPPEVNFPEVSPPSNQSRSGTPLFDTDCTAGPRKSGEENQGGESGNPASGVTLVGGSGGGGGGGSSKGKGGRGALFLRLQLSLRDSSVAVTEEDVESSRALQTLLGETPVGDEDGGAAGGGGERGYVGYGEADWDAEGCVGHGKGRP